MVQAVDPTVLAVVVATVLAGAGGFFVPVLIGRIPPHVVLETTEEPTPAGSEVDGTVDAISTVVPAEPPEPFPDIARLPGLGWKSALAAAVAGAIVGVAVGWTWALVLWIPLVPVSVALAVVDWRTRLLPTAVIRPTYGLLVALVLLGWAVTGDTDDVVRAALGWLVAGGLYGLLWLIYPRGLGFGDVRLAGVLGIALGWVGWGSVTVGVYAGFLLGGVLGGLLSVLRIVERKGFPFGPFMLLGALVGLLWGEQLWSALVSG
jgi:leader peptidase (prepilin peptidase)/N-methyltransferase